jgi:HEPN domain-containing protein
MSMPNSEDARLYYRCAYQRYDEAELLFEAGFTTGAVYLAGYGVECMLKALALMAVPVKKRNRVHESFRGSRAHDYEWLRSIYLESGGSRYPPEINRHFVLVSNWSTELRYTPRRMKERDAEDFLNGAAAILQWADGRI